LTQNFVFLAPFSRFFDNQELKNVAFN